jgi:hypothetical protein
VTQLRNAPKTYRLDKQQKFRFSAPLEDTEVRFTFVEKLISDMLAHREKPAPIAAARVGST